MKHLEHLGIEKVFLRCSGVPLAVHEIIASMKQKLTKSVIDALACSVGQQDFLVFDTELTGFAVRVTESGTERFMLQYTRAGTTKRLALGKYGEVTVFEARKLALTALGELTEGGDPVAARKERLAAAVAAEADRKREAEEDAFTVKKLIETWSDTGLKAAGARHHAENPRAITKLLIAHLTLPARALTPAQTQRAVDDLSITAPVMANRSRNYAKAAFGWATRRKFIPSNPFAGVEVEGREKSRERVLTEAELGEAWRAAGELTQPWRSFYKTLILTLQRRGEVAGMEWKELSGDFTTWTVPAARAKNGKAHIVHLTESAGQILRTTPRIEKSKFVFTTTGTVPINSFPRVKEWLAAEILKERGSAAKNMPAIDWTPHDLRRTGVTALAGMGFPIHVADKLLNHVQGSIRGVAAVYQRNEFLSERARALDAWAEHVIRQAEGKSKLSNVISLTG
jgi:integrase